MTGHSPLSEESVSNALDALMERRLVKVNDMGHYALADVIKAKAHQDARRKWGESCLAEEVKKGIIKVKPTIRWVSP
jgi:hypothetical protein